jgi:hypothetical protein
MDHGRKLPGRFGPDPRGWRIGIAQRRMRLLELLELAQQTVVLGIRKIRIVEDVIAMVGAVDAAAQFGDAGGG